MRDQEIIGLYEAYHQVYAPQELTEEVEIAAQYFYEMGLNEDGVDILIEDLGVEEFADWVYEIAEDYTLTEARAGGSRIEPVTAKGQKFKSGKPTGKSLERLRAQKAARREAENKASESKPSGMTSALERQSAVANAQKKQPEKSGSPKGIAGRIGAALGGAVKRAKRDIELTKKTAQTVSKAVGTGIEALNRASDTRLARQARVATHKGVKRHTQALSAAGGALGRSLGASTARRRSQHEEVDGRLMFESSEDLFDYLLEYLVVEGYADTNKAALAIMANMSEEWRQSIVEMGENIGREPKTVGGRERPGVPGETYAQRQERMKPKTKPVEEARYYGRRGDAVGGADRDGGRNRYLGSPTPSQEAEENKRAAEAAKRAVEQARRRRAAEAARRNNG